MHGIASLAFAGVTDGGAPQTRLTDLAQHAPLRVLFPREPGCGLLQAVLVTTCGGMVGGDVYDFTMTAGAGSAVLLTTQAAEKVYRSLGADTRINVTLHAAAGSWVEWMPQETILFDGSRLDRRTIVDLAAGARFLGGEIVVFGRTARGEALTRGSLRDSWQIRVGGRLVWADALLLDGDIAATLGLAAGLDSAVAAATLVYAGADAAVRLDSARAVLTELVATASATDADRSGLRLAATCVNGLLVVRGLARDARQLRQAVIGFWGAFRALAAGLPPLVPRVWLG